MTEPDDAVIRFADRLDALRIIPRLLVIGYGLFLGWFAFYLADWIMSFDWSSLESEAVALAIVAFPTGVLGVMAGVFGKMADNYFRTGRGGNGG
jgi:hypothetical protein